jgi:hypothetical protein
MTTMTKKLATYRSAMPQIKLWVVIAAVLGAALLAYYANLGLRYLDASREAATTTAEVERLSRTLESATAGADGGRGALDTTVAKVQDLMQVFDYPQRDTLVAHITQTAESVPVALTGVSVGETQSVVEDGIRYRMQPMSITLLGEMSDIDAFLARLQETVPMVEVASFAASVSSEEGSSVSIGLAFHLAPQAAPTPLPTRTPR